MAQYPFSAFRSFYAILTELPGPVKAKPHLLTGFPARHCSAADVHPNDASRCLRQLQRPVLPKKFNSVKKKLFRGKNPPVLLRFCYTLCSTNRTE